ncbi:hypothetical protein JW823_00120 [bacterium]|nr:hypothetical protein [candidate division CSSED10-310 bacterium]
MVSGSGSGDSQKNQRLHEMALAMYRTGDLHAAQKIWRRLQEQDPGFPDIDKWLEKVNQALKRSIPNRQQPDPSVFRTQRELMANHGQGPRRRVFHPQKSHIQLEKGIRHRHIVAIFMIIILLILLLSIRNNRSFLIQLNPKTNALVCYQGNFFPVGWQKTLDIDVGIEPDWINYVDDQAIIKDLQKGIIVHSLKKFDERIIDVFMTLGDESLLQMTERGQQSAIYYFKRISSARYETLVREKIAKAFLNLFQITMISRDYEAAARYLDSSKKYVPSNPELIPAQQQLTDALQTSDPIH